MIKYYNFEYLGKPEGMYTEGKRGSIVVRSSWFRSGLEVRIVHGLVLREYLDSTRHYATIEALEADFKIVGEFKRRDFIVGQKSEVLA